MHMTRSVGVAGATGYAGGEILRLLLTHPELEVGTLCAHSSTGTLGQHQPHLVPLEATELSPISAERLAEHDVVVLGLPHGASAKVTAEILALNADLTIVDLGADHRLEDGADWEAFYGSSPAEPWTYGMPELHRNSGCTQRELLSETARIAAPGCNASAVTFAVQPAIAAGLSNGTGLVSVLAVGYSGAGKAAKTHLLAAEALGAATPYSVAGTHRHIPEIAQNLRATGGSTRTLSFTPVLVPMSRGILATVSIPVAGSVTAEQVTHAYRSALIDEPFVRWSEQWPTTASVVGANTALVHAELDRDGEHITAICALDNLVKGTAGAAIQSLNLALGLPETMGLETIGVAP